MAITIELTPEEEADLQRRASARGMALPEFVKLRLLEADEARIAPFREVGTPEEAADEAAWAKSFAKSGDLLDRLAAEAAEEHRQGRTLPLENLLDGRA